jgi:hypothetical protein
VLARLDSVLDHAEVVPAEAGHVSLCPLPQVQASRAGLIGVHAVLISRHVLIFLAWLYASAALIAPMHLSGCALGLAIKTRLVVIAIAVHDNYSLRSK